jgi:hypothetical protein
MVVATTTAQKRFALFFGIVVPVGIATGVVRFSIAHFCSPVLDGWAK